MYDAVVIGLGGVGSFALRSLAKRLKNNNKHNMKILGLERFHIGHTNGSSHGESRIYRHAYFEHVNYVPLLLYSSTEFRLLEQQSDDDGQKRNIITPCGTLVIDSLKKDDTDTEMVKEESKDKKEVEQQQQQLLQQYGLVAACQKSANQHDIPVQYMTSSELRDKYPQFIFQDDDIGLLEPGGGFVRPELAIRAALDDAIQLGAEVKENVCVSSIEETVGVDRASDDNREEGHVIIHINSGDDIMAKKVIVSGGAWMGKLIPEWSSHLHVTRQVQAWVDVGCDTSYQPNQMPTWIRSSLSTSNNGVENIYGIPADPLSDKPTWIKVAIHGRNDVVNDVDESIPRPDVTEDEIKELKLAAQDFLRPIAAASDNNDTSTKSTQQQHGSSSSSSTTTSPFVQAKSCLYTNSPDKHFIVGQPKAYQYVYGAAGLSGHGFKMTPALGKILSDLALDGSTDLPVDFLSPKRFDI